MQFSNAYLLPILIAMLIIFINIIFSQKLKYDRRFTSDLSNRLYALSFVKPFSWFVNPDENDQKVKEYENLIKTAGFDHVLNYRVFMTFQTAHFLIVLILYSIIFLFMDQIVAFLDFIFRIENPTRSATMDTRILIGIILLLSVLMPKYYLKRKAKKNEFYLTQELPVIQLSIILMLRAKRPINEIMYTLGRNQTRYRKTFEKAHRMYLRDKSDCWNFLREEFSGTGFEDTVDVLASIDKYSRQKTIYVLENGMEHLVQQSSEHKKKGAAFGNLFSQFSMAIPFGGVLLLGAVPFAMFIFDYMGSGLTF